MHRWAQAIRPVVVLLVALVAGVANSTTAAAQTGPAHTGHDAIRVQLKWVTQAQFAGFYIAQEKGFYAAERLDVTLLPGGPDLAPEDEEVFRPFLE